MSWLIGAAVTATLLTLRGPGGRPAVRVTRSRAGAVGGPVTVSGVVGGPGSRLSRRLHVRRGMTARAEPGLALLVTDVAARLRSGADPRTAWAQVLGHPVPPGGPTMADLVRHPHERPQAAVVVVAGRVATELGAPLAPLLDGVARDLAAQAEADGDRRAALAGPRATARVLTWLPVLGVVLGTAVGADPVAVLLDGALGSTALAGGVVLVLVGRSWTVRLARSAAAAGRPA